MDENIKSSFVHQADVKISGHRLAVELVVLPIVKFDVILGID